MSTTTRVLGVADWEKWRDLRLQALRESPAAFGSTFERERDFPPETWQERLAATHSVAVMAEVDRVPAGIAAAFPDVPGLLHVVAMWVAPAARGHGVAGALLTELESWADARGLGLHLDVETDNEPARRSYVRHGFAATGETRALREGSEQRVERMVLERPTPRR